MSFVIQNVSYSYELNEQACSLTLTKKEEDIVEKFQIPVKKYSNNFFARTYVSRLSNKETHKPVTSLPGVLWNNLDDIYVVKIRKVADACGITKNNALDIILYGNTTYRNRQIAKREKSIS